MGTVAPSSTDCGIVYESISGPNRRIVLRPNPLSMGVPVNPNSAAFGNAFDIRAPSVPYCVRCASSTITTTRSDAFSTSSRPEGASSASSNF